MIDRLIENFPLHEIKSIDAENCYIIDHKQDDGGAVEIHDAQQVSNAVHLSNPFRTPIYFDGFPENAFQEAPGVHLSQCECIVFPQNCQQDDWILVIETKYSTNIENAFNEKNDYPHIMIGQVINTINHLREKGIIPQEKQVNAIVSFPNLIENFSAFFFTKTPTIEDILINHRIKIRATNEATIRNKRKIYIGEIRTFA